MPTRFLNLFLLLIQGSHKRNKFTRKIVTAMTTSTPAFNIANSVALVTGTNKSNGIGAHIVRALIEQGAKKVYATARDASQLDYLVQELGQDKVVPVALDVTDVAAIKKLPSELPDVNLIVNNAGYFGSNSSLQSIDVARKEYEVNVQAPLAIVQSFAPTLLKLATEEDTSNKASAIVNINSIGSLVNFPAGATYSASKAAAHSLTQAQRRDLPQSLVVGVYPGPIDTDMAKDFPSTSKASPRDVALAVTKALEEGSEDVFPDAIASQLYEGWKHDAKAVEKQMAATAEAA
jgi:NAD(P)-dependent dehydrogenase (short-subunit alcohol dehydrogenase family)